MMRIVNTDLLSQPVNYITVPLMIIIGAFILFLLDPWGARK